MLKTASNRSHTRALTRARALRKVIRRALDVLDGNHPVAQSNSKRVLYATDILRAVERYK
jgi:hypothetical protein